MKPSGLTPSDPMLRMHYPGFVFRTLCNEGHRAEILLAETGLTDDMLSDPTFRSDLPPIRRLILNAIQHTGDPHLGIRLADRFEPSFSGLPAFTAMNAATFKDALEVLNRFFFLSFPVLEFMFSDDGAAPGTGEATIRLRPKMPLGDVSYFACISALVASDRLFRAILRSDHVTLRAETIVGEPDGWATVAQKVSFPLRFGSDENRIFFPAALLDQLLPGADPINHRRFLALCEDFATRTPMATTPVARVVQFLRDGQRFDIPLPEVAAELGYSERNLRRHLERAGTSYRQLLDEVRERRARDMLTEGAVPINVIAHMLGFDSGSNFARSFKRWTGFTPTAFRERH